MFLQWRRRHSFWQSIFLQSKLQIRKCWRLSNNNWEWWNEINQRTEKVYQDRGWMTMSHGNLLHCNPTTGLELGIYNLQSLSNVEPNSQELVNKNSGSRGGIPSCQLLTRKASEAPQETRLLPFLLSSHWKLFEKKKTPHMLGRDTEKWNKNWNYLETSFLILTFHSDKTFNICCLWRKRYQWSYKMTPLRTTKPTCQAWWIYL